MKPTYDPFIGEPHLREMLREDSLLARMRFWRIVAMTLERIAELEFSPASFRVGCEVIAGQLQVLKDLGIASDPSDEDLEAVRRK